MILEAIGRDPCGVVPTRFRAPTSPPFYDYCPPLSTFITPLTNTPTRRFFACPCARACLRPGFCRLALEWTSDEPAYVDFGVATVLAISA